MPDSLRRFKADIFQALSHPTRIAILELLSEDELSAGTLIEKLGMEQANISQHLGVLRAKQILVNRRAGNRIFHFFPSLRLDRLSCLLQILGFFCQIRRAGCGRRPLGRRFLLAFQRLKRVSTLARCDLMHDLVSQGSPLIQPFSVAPQVGMG